MSPDRDRRRGDEGQSFEEYEGDAPRSIFSALWFRALVAVLVLGVIAAVAVPYILDFASHQTSKPTATKARAAPPTAAPAAPAVATEPPPTAATPAAPPPAAAPPAVAPSPAPPATTKSGAPAKGTKSKSTAIAKASEGTKEAKAAPASKSSSGAAAAAASPGGTYWVQVGAFRDVEAAKRVTARLKEQGFSVEQSTTGGKSAAQPPASPPSLPPQPQGDRYHVVVSGATTADVDAKLAAKGMTSEATSGGVLVQPSLPLREAVALSRDLADSGMTVQVRRVGGGAAAAAAPPTPPSPAPSPTTAAKETLHRVRVGGFTDRAGATAVMKHLEEKGYKPYIARGND